MEISAKTIKRDRKMLFGRIYQLRIMSNNWKKVIGFGKHHVSLRCTYELLVFTDKGVKVIFQI